MALSEADAIDTRRFAGYAIASAYVYQPLDVQGNSNSLDAVLLGLDAAGVSVLQTMLTSLRQLEADLPATRGTLVLAKAAVFERNPAELSERTDLYIRMRRRLCAFLGVSPGPGIYAEGTTATYLPAVLTV